MKKLKELVTDFQNQFHHNHSLIGFGSKMLP